MVDVSILFFHEATNQRVAATRFFDFYSNGVGKAEIRIQAVLAHGNFL